MANSIILSSSLRLPRSVLRDTNDGALDRGSSSLTWNRLCHEGQFEHWPRPSFYPPQGDKDAAVAVILGYYNGNRYLPAQTRSILDQSHRNLTLFICDDHSDEAVDIEALGLVSDELKKIYLGIRPANIGFARNFLSALQEIDQDFSYFAFSDQDDIWHTDKLSDALKVLGSYPPDRPALYCARTRIVDEYAQVEHGNSRLFTKSVAFANALVQNIGGGNTMVFNKAARDLIVASSANVEVVYHDWWCYQIVSGAGGVVHYDPKPCLKYRQHGAELLGANKGWVAKRGRFFGLLRGNFRNWNTTHLKGLAQNKDFLTPENCKRLDDFIAARKSSLLRRFLLSLRAGIYRQTLFDNFGLFLGLLVNRV